MIFISFVLLGGISLALGSMPDISSNIRSDYLMGHPIPVKLTFRNTSNQTITVPNIESESWRIQFQLTNSKGETQSRSTRPDVYPEPSTWIIDPRQSRTVWVELPAGQGLKSGAYELSFSIDLEAESYQSEKHLIHIQAPKPVDSYFDLLQHPLSHQSNPSLWTHQSANGYDIYLHHSHINTPNQTLFHDLTLHHEDLISPRLSVTQSATRHLVWQHSPRQISYLTLQHNFPRRTPQQLAVPWPSAELMGHPITAPDGSPQMLLWIPSPSTGGELRWCSVLDSGIPIYRKLKQSPSKPSLLSMSMNDQGEALIALVEQNTLLLFTGTDVSERPNIPLKSKVLATLETQALALQFSVHPEKGQILQLLQYSSEKGLYQTSLSLSGELLNEIVLSTYPYQDQPIVFSPHPQAPAVIVLDSKQNILSFHGKDQPIALPNHDWSLDRGQDGTLWIVGGGHMRPPFSQKIESPAP